MSELKYPEYPYKKCLDKGFVALVDSMGDDSRIVQAARVSYQKGTKAVSTDRNLIRYLLRNHHSTPLEKVRFEFHVRLPMFIARQWMRHRSGCLAGDTNLYADDEASSGITIKELWEKVRLLKENGNSLEVSKIYKNTQLKMCIEEASNFGSTQINDIWQTGVKKVYLVKLENGYEIKMTQDHRCLTTDGWMTLGEATNLISHNGEVSWDIENSSSFAVLSPNNMNRKTYSKVKSVSYAGEEMTYDIEVTGPYHNFIANGFVVHNSFNEVSARYSVLPGDFYIPEPLRKQSETNRQGSGDEVIESIPGITGSPQEHLEGICKKAYNNYEELIEAGAARELARTVLPVNIYTEFYWTVDLWNLMHFLRLRLDGHAQYEIRVFGQAILKLIKENCELEYAIEAFEDYILKAPKLTRYEVETAVDILGKHGLGEEVIKALKAHSEMSGREKNESKLIALLEKSDVDSQPDNQVDIEGVKS